MGRKPKEPPLPLPFGLRQGAPVKVSSKDNFKGYKVGVVTGWCPKKDGGIYVWLSVVGSLAKYLCVRTERGDTIESLNERTDTISNVT